MRIGIVVQDNREMGENPIRSRRCKGRIISNISLCKKCFIHGKIRYGVDA